ncbi:MAG: class I SAM-dependent methyltransferase [Solirubrobacteraceae bacterium]
MSWHADARELAQRAGLDPRYLRRWRWISKARAVRRAGGSLSSNLGYVLTDPEPNNFSYELANESDMIAWVAAVARCSPDDARRVTDEAHSDPVLRQRLRAATEGHWAWSKPEPPFGKRLGWYALVRLLSPGLVIEAGVHDGLGSLLLLRALELNAGEGPQARLVSFDVNPAAGWLAAGHPGWELRLESTRSGLPTLLADAPQVDLFIHDSLHTYEHERFELRTVAPRLSPGGVLVSDNVHATPALTETSEEFGFEYHEFYERPRDHFYTGGAVGAARRLSDRANPDTP